MRFIMNIMIIMVRKVKFLNKNMILLKKKLMKKKIQLNFQNFIINIKLLDVWSSNPFLQVGIGKIISRDKFKYIERFFHLGDNSNPSASNMHKISSLINHFNNVSQRIW